MTVMYDEGFFLFCFAGEEFSLNSEEKVKTWSDLMRTRIN